MKQFNIAKFQFLRSQCEEKFQSSCSSESEVEQDFLSTSTFTTSVEGSAEDTTGNSETGSFASTTESISSELLSTVSQDVSSAIETSESQETASSSTSTTSTSLPTRSPLCNSHPVSGGDYIHNTKCNQNHKGSYGFEVTFGSNTKISKGVYAGFSVPTQYDISVDSRYYSSSDKFASVSKDYNNVVTIDFNTGSRDFGHFSFSASFQTSFWT